MDAETILRPPSLSDVRPKMARSLLPPAAQDIGSSTNEGHAINDPKELDAEPSGPNNTQPRETESCPIQLVSLAAANPTSPGEELPGAEGAETTNKPSRGAIALIMAPLCLSVTLSALDLTIVTPAIPAIVGDFESTSGYIWVGSAFILAYTAITPVWGSVADIWGRKPIMLIALSIFLVASLLCALAPTMDALIVGRTIQGLGASGIGMMVNIIICDTFSLRDRALYLAITSIVWAVGSAVGPVLGGVFTTELR